MATRYSTMCTDGVCGLLQVLFYLLSSNLQFSTFHSLPSQISDSRYITPTLSPPPLHTFLPSTYISHNVYNKNVKCLTGSGTIYANNYQNKYMGGASLHVVQICCTVKKLCTVLAYQYQYRILNNHDSNFGFMKNIQIFPSDIPESMQ